MPSWLVLSCALTFGFLPQNVTVVDKAKFSGVDGAQQWATTMEVDAVAWDHLKLWGKVQTYEYNLIPYGMVAFAPFRDDYWIGAELQLTKNLSVGAEHECIHDVIYARGQPAGVTGAHTMIYGKIQFSTGGSK